MMTLSTLAFVCLVLIVLLFSILYIGSVPSYWKKRNVPYCSQSWLLISEIKLFFLQISIGDFLWKLYDKFKGKVIGFKVFGAPCVLLKDVDIIKNILVKDFHNFQDRTVASEPSVDPLGSRVLFTAKNPQWRHSRTNISSTFSTGRLRSSYQQIIDVVDNLIQFITKHKGNPVDAKETCHKFSTDAITSCAFGINANCFVDENSVSRKFARKMLEYQWLRGFIFMCYYHLPCLVRVMRMTFLNTNAGQFILDLFHDVANEREAQNDFKNDYIGKLIQLVNENKYLKVKEEVYAQAAQFWLAGFETIGSSLMFLLYELSHHQDIQDKLRGEIQSIIKSKREISYDTIREMRYLTMCMNESFRKYPVLPFLDRICISDYKIPDTDMTLGANTKVFVSIQGLAYDDEHFPDPYKFNPERWSPENGDDIKAFSFLAFGEGPRNCIGKRFGKLNVAVAAVKVINEFKVFPIGPYENIKYDSKGFLLSPEKLIELKFEKL